ncbi:uncharacterized protein LOC100899133 [Galendromus occidentalis]|uniref:Uncharacterized protein LOC100899133 n=1 Tax=Galendromus occidentalis TaxID=34638 RepID=A0AAJ7SF30_9ACAR|nr:uncharacterized protein LOC100899133 [Galendromus occidentalis]
MTVRIMLSIFFVTFFGFACGHFRTLEKARLSTLSCKSNCLENFTPPGLQGEFNCFQHSYCWTCWFGCKLFHQNLAAWTVLCSQKSHEICLEGCQTSCRFHQNDNELDEAAHPEGPLTTQEVVEDVKYQYDLEYNTTNIEWDYKPNAEVNGLILVVGTNESLSDTESLKPHELFIIGRTYYRNITIDDKILDEFCTIRLATVDSSKKISLLNIHTEHLKRHTNKCHSTGVHHHPPIISSIHVTDLRRRYNLSMSESSGSTTSEPSSGSTTPAPPADSAAANGVASLPGDPSSNSTPPAKPSDPEPSNVTSPRDQISTARPLELFAAPILVALTSPPSTGPSHLSGEDLSPEVLRAEIRWEPFVNSSEDASCIKYKVTWKSALIDKVAGDLLTCSTNTSISVERNSVYHVWVSLFGHEQIRTQQLTVETAYAQYAKLRAMEICHGCVRGDYTTSVSAALASVIVLAVAVFLLIKSYRSYTLRDHNLRSHCGSSFLMPNALLGELGAKPSMQVIEPKMLTSNSTSSRVSAHVTITPIAAHGPEEAPSSSRNGTYEPLSLEDEDANYFVFDLPKNYTAV